MGADLDKILVFGHRGTGKTSLLKRWQAYSPEYQFLDLDEEIEKRAKLSITEIFAQKSEEGFRELEKKTWAELNQAIQEPTVISVGGGFNLDWVGKDWTLFWLRRDTDSPDRIFLDRPSLANYPERFNERQKKFQQKAQRIYTMPEGLLMDDDEEKQILLRTFENIGGVVTLPLETYPHVTYEVRDDLPLKNYPQENLLYSVRGGATYPADTKIDWDLKRPLPPDLKPYIISTHENDLKPLEKFESSTSLLKYCPDVETWSDLEKGLIWHSQNPKRHMFLPRSESGRWSWFRLWLKGRQALNFWREGQGSASDQPTLWEWLSHPQEILSFAAVLGAPIKQSFSPTYHKNFFNNFGIPFYRIHLEEDEWDQALPILKSMGLVAAAVTSPLKERAGLLVNDKPLNTLWLEDDQWKGANTDLAGSDVLLSPYKNKSTVIWGGGGVLESLKKILPKASFYSSQKAQPRQGFNEIKNPEVVVWADPRNSINHIPKDWKPAILVDLSYHDKSPARIYAQKIQAQYVSGIGMFLKQADEQQKIWQNHLKPSRS